MRTNHRNRGAVVLAMGLLGVLGCVQDGPVTHPVAGKVELAGGDVKQLAGSHIEAALVSDPAIRASGVIGEAGGFTLETIHAGVILKGAREGKYQVRIIPEDDDRATQRRQRAALAGRYLQFKTSGLSLDVPTGSEVTLTVSPR